MPQIPRDAMNSLFGPPLEFPHHPAALVAHPSHEREELAFSLSRNSLPVQREGTIISRALATAILNNSQNKGLPKRAVGLGGY